MNWVKENKFLTGFLVVMVVGVAVLGYVLDSAWGTYNDTTDQYTAKANELRRLQGLTPYPSEPNLRKYKAERQTVLDAASELADNLAKMTVPEETLTPSEFQDRLRDAVTSVTDQAKKDGVKLPEGFSLSFDRYQTEPPRAEAAGPLGRQLGAIRIAVGILLDEHVDSIATLTRVELPEEGGHSAAAAGPGGQGPGGQGSGGQGPGRRGAGAEEGLVEKRAMDVQFTATQPALQKVLNDLAASDKQFFITRTLVVENSNPKPVSRVSAEDAAAAAAAAGPGGAPGTAPGQPGTSGTEQAANYLKFIVGTEKLNVALRVESVWFNPPGKTAENGGNGGGGR